MHNKKSVGRPQKINYKIMAKLEDALRNGANVSEATRYAEISRDTYYRYLNTYEDFALRMQSAHKNRSLLSSMFF